MEDLTALLAELLQQEEQLQWQQCTNDDALALGTLLVETARNEGKSVTIDIVRHGQQLFHCALTGTSPDNDAWIQRKNRVVTHFGHSSYYIGRLLAQKGSTIEATYFLDPRLYSAHGGAFPIIIRGVGVVGTVTVSGLPQAEDHALVVRVLAQFLTRQGQ